MKNVNQYNHLGGRELEILSLISKMSFLTACIVAPNLIKLYPMLFHKKTSKEKYIFKKKIEKFEKDELIFLGGEKIELTEKGKKILRMNQELNIEPNVEKWDKVWKVIAYDIPKNKSKERNFFQRKLKNTGFIQLQKSVWIIPFDCKEEIAIFAQDLGITPFVLYLKTDTDPKFYKYYDCYGLKIQDEILNK